MGIFTKDTNTSNTQDVNQTQQSTQQSSQRKQTTESQQRGTVTGKTGTSASSADVSSLSTLFSQDTLDQLRSLLPLLTGQVQGGGVFGQGAKDVAGNQADFAQTLQDRAMGTTDFFMQQFAPIAAERTRQFEQNTMRDINQIAQRGGARQGSSFIDQLISQGQQDLQTRLGAEQAKLLLGGRQLESQDAIQAFGAGSQAGSDLRSIDTGMNDAVANLTRLTSVLRGGETQTSGQQSQDVVTNSQQEVQDTLNRLLDSLTGGASDTTSKTSGTQVSTQQTQQGRDLLDFLSLLA